MREHKGFLIACLFAATAPLWNGAYGVGSVDADDFPGWPAQLEGRPLEPRAIDAVELRLAEHFPGRVGRFSDGVDEWILRWIAEPTRELHSAADCYRGLGYRIEGEGIVRDDSGRE